MPIARSRASFSDSLRKVQIGAAPQPRDIVNSLVGAHLLVRSAGIDGRGFRFSIKLFQEWYAADEVEKGDVEGCRWRSGSAQNRLREDIPELAELGRSQSFACEPGSRGANATGAPLRWRLRFRRRSVLTRPLGGHNVGNRATDAVWLLVRGACPALCLPAGTNQELSTVRYAS